MTARRWGAYDAPRWANQQRVGSVGLKAVLMLLAAYADEDFSCFPGQERIADETEQSVSTVRRQLLFLEALGLFHRERRYAGQATRKTDRYVLHLDVMVTLADVDRVRAGLAAAPAGDVIEGGFPQADAPSRPLPVRLTGSDVSAGQALPVNLTGSAHYRSNEAPLPVTGDRYELLEELLDSDGVLDLDLTRDDDEPTLSTGPDPDRQHDVDDVVDLRDPSPRPSWAGPGVPPPVDVLAAARAANAARRSRGPSRAQDAYLERTTAFADRDPGRHAAVAAAALADLEDRHATP